MQERVGIVEVIVQQIPVEILAGGERPQAGESDGDRPDDDEGSRAHLGTSTRKAESFAGASGVRT